MRGLLLVVFATAALAQRKPVFRIDGVGPREGGAAIGDQPWLTPKELPRAALPGRKRGASKVHRMRLKRAIIYLTFRESGFMLDS